MQKFTLHKGLVAPMDRANVDTDAIIPKQFLKSIRKTGFGPNLFDEWRYLDQPGQPGVPESDRKPNPDFVLNQPRYKGASILLARKNFGCGSSREHAPWAIDQYGFRTVIAPSFADIFFNNCFKNGLLPIVLPERQVAQLFDEVAAFPGYSLTVDLERQVVVKPDGAEGVIVEVNCQTDFVAKGDEFQGFAAAVAASARKRSPSCRGRSGKDRRPRARCAATDAKRSSQATSASAIGNTGSSASTRVPVRTSCWPPSSFTRTSPLRGSSGFSPDSFGRHI